MATRPDPARAQEWGVSLIEALVIVTVTALLALLLLPLASGAAQRNFSMAETAVDETDAAVAEAQFRALVRAAIVRTSPGGQEEGVVGNARQVTITPGLASAHACVREGAAAIARLRISGRQLLCESAGRASALLAWRSGAAELSYSENGRGWTNTWSGAGAPFVRFRLNSAAGSDLIWVERVGQVLPQQSEGAP